MSTEAGNDHQILRIAVCQLASHPAFVLDSTDFLAEPTIPNEAHPSLASVKDYHPDLVPRQLPIFG